MPGYMLRNNQTGHPVMGEIGPRRTAVFIGQEPPSVYIYDASLISPRGKHAPQYMTWDMPIL